MKTGKHAPNAAFLAGRKPVLETLAASPDRVLEVFVKKGAGGPVVAEILDACSDAGVPFRMKTARDLDRMHPGNHQGVVARVAAMPTLSVDEVLDAVLEAPVPLLAALDRVKDPGNVGTLARTLYALGCGGIMLPRHESALPGPAALKASAGALGRLPLCVAPNLAQALDQALDRGFALYCAQNRPDAANAFTTGLNLPAVLVLGSEETGIRAKVAERCGVALSIPFLRDFDSLNVAQAGAILAARFASIV